MTLTRTAPTSAQALAMELGITDTAKKAKAYDLILALLTLERERCAVIADEHANQCRSKLNKKRSDHDLAVFESAMSEAASIATAIRRGDS